MKWAVIVEEITRYRIEVEADTQQAAYETALHALEHGDKGTVEPWIETRQAAYAMKIDGKTICVEGAKEPPARDEI